jgi:hypothetical protein
MWLPIQIKKIKVKIPESPIVGDLFIGQGLKAPSGIDPRA